VELILLGQIEPGVYSIGPNDLYTWSEFFLGPND